MWLVTSKLFLASLNGIIHQSKTVITGMQCISKQPWWCQSNFCFAPGKGYCGNEWVTSLLSLDYWLVTTYWVASTKVSSPGYLLRSCTFYFLEVSWCISWDRTTGSACSSFRNCQRVSSMTYINFSCRKSLFCSLKLVCHATVRFFFFF